MTIEKTTKSLLALLICATASVTALQAVAQQEAGETQEPDLSDFDFLPGTPVDRAYLSVEEVYEIFNEYPVFCDGDASYLNCVELTFKTKSEGMMRGEYHQHDDILVDAYEKGPFYLTDHGLCLRKGEGEENVEIIESDSAESRYEAAAFRYFIELEDKYVSQDCIRFAYPEVNATVRRGVILEEYESFQLTDGEWKFFPDPTTIVLSDSVFGAMPALYFTNGVE